MEGGGDTPWVSTLEPLEEVVGLDIVFKAQRPQIEPFRSI